VTAGASPRAVRFVVLTVLIDAMGFGIVMPVLPRLVMQLAHVELTQATRIGGWLAAAYAAVQFLSGPLVGNLGDRFGRRPVLLGSLAGFAVDYSLQGFAPTVGWLFAGRALAGLFGASFGPAGAAMADLSEPEERARLFGLIGAAFGIGFVIGPAIGGLLGGLGPRAPFHAAALLAAGNLLFGLFAFPETLAPEHRRPFSPARANPLGALLSLRHVHGLLPIAFAGFWWNLAGMVYPSVWSFYAIAAFGWSPALIGASLTWVGMLMAGSQVLLVGRLVKRLGERRAAALGIAAASAGFIGYALISQGWMVFALTLVLVLQATVMPALSGLMSRAVPRDRQGELQGFNGSIAAVGAILAPLAYNPVLAWFTRPEASPRLPGAPFLLAAAAALVALAILLASNRVQTPPGTAS
jgi:DHA1 family tetracycline resistance protein-like MFS transporter